MEVRFLPGVLLQQRLDAAVLLRCEDCFQEAGEAVVQVVLAEGEEAAQTTVVAGHDGSFLTGLDGDVVGIFGAPCSHEDDPMRALRAADELCARVEAIHGLFLKKYTSAWLLSFVGSSIGRGRPVELDPIAVSVQRGSSK